MERKKFVIAFHFKAEFEATTDSEALCLAAAAIPHGFRRTKGLAMSVVAAVPIAETPAPAAVIPGPLSESPVSDTPVAPKPDAA